MFWTYNTTSPQIDIVLCKEDLTLHELLDQENILQELKAQNLKLIEFLIKPEVLHELVTLITTEPPLDTDYKYPNLACELLTSDLPALNERLASEEILNMLYCFLQNDPPLNPLLSSYFSRTLSILISRKSEQNWFSYQYTCLRALEFLKAKEEFIELLLKHMGTSSIMDLMHNLVTLIEGPELKQSLWNWLQSQNVIPSLISLLGPSSDVDCQTNTASLLCSIIQKLRENLVELNDKSVSDPILYLLESAQVTKLLLDTVFGSDTLCDTSIESGVDVLLTLMHPYLPGDARCRQTLNYTVHDKMDSGLVIANNDNSNSRSDSANDSEDLNQRPLPPLEIIDAILPFINKFQDILTNPLKKEPIKLTCGIVSPPFGKVRLLIAKLIGVLISLNSSVINKEIMRCDIPELLLNLFYAYWSNNFLHTEVEKLIAHAIDQMTECNDDSFLIHLLKKCNLLKRLLDIWQENIERENSGQCRRGYMGHVIRIATLIHIESGKNLAFNKLLMKESSSQVMSDWNTFVNDSLENIIEKHSTCLGGVRPKVCQSNDNSFEENISSKELKSGFKNFDQNNDQIVIFSNESTLMDYGEESYRLNNGFTEEEEEQLECQTKMFDLLCAQKWQSFTKGLDNLDDNDEDSNSGQNYRWRGFQNYDSDDENIEENTQDVLDPWLKLGNVSNPWVSSTSNESNDSSWNARDNDTNWAKFDENFSGVFSSNHDNDAATEVCSTLAAKVDHYDLFSDGDDPVSEKANVLNNFNDVKISSNITKDRGDSQIQLENRSEIVNDQKWDVASNATMKTDNESNGYNIRQEYNCFHEQEKDSLDEMLNLEYISGNTLAEKLANAENDIRNKDEEEQQHHHHHQQQSLQNDRRLMNSFDEASEQILCNSSECDIRLRLSSSSGEEMLEDERVYDQNASYLSQQDCLTENSFDFVTAENNTSDTESSIDFADAENSLELEEEDITMERSCSSPFNELTSSTTNCNECSDREMSTPDNVPIGSENNDECNNVRICEDGSKKEERKGENENVTATKSIADAAEIDVELRTSINGVISEYTILKDCGKFEDVRNSSHFSKQEAGANIKGAVIEEPA